MPTITRERATALASGKKRYISAFVCPNGHDGAERYSSNGQCVKCKEDSRSKKRQKNPPLDRSFLSKRAHAEKLKERTHSWVNGILPIVSSDNRAIRRMLAEARGYFCSVCKISEWNGKPITLEVEHIDGNSGNNNFENVCLICPNCHSQTPTYKGANKGNGRHYRRKRYAEGKSY